MASLNFTAPLGLTSNNPFRETMESASDPLKSTIQAAQLNRYNKGTASATDVLAVLKKKRKDERAKKGIKPKDLNEFFGNRKKEVETTIPNMMKTDEFKNNADERAFVRDYAKNQGMTTDQIDTQLGSIYGNRAKQMGAAPTQQQKIEQIRKNVGNMKQSRYESQKAAQQKRYDQRFADMDKQKKLKEQIKAARQKKRSGAQESKTKAPAGTTQSTDSKGNATSNAPKVSY